MADRCALCERELPLTFHHLIPRKAHRRPRFRKRMNRDTLALGVMICRLCHRGIHRRYDELHLANHLNTVEALASDPDLARHFAWVARQKALA